jgi:hypothetical protein
VTAKFGFIAGLLGTFWNDYRIVTAGGKRMAMKNPPKREQTAPKYTVTVDRFQSVLRARRHIATGRH